MTSMVPASVRVRREDASSASRVVAGAGGVKGRPVVGPGFGLTPTLSTSRSAANLLPWSVVAFGAELQRHIHSLSSLTCS